MKHILSFLLLFVSMLSVAQEANYDESLIGPLNLPDPLIAQDGTTIQTTRQWEKIRRPELLSLFQENEYGSLPQTKVKMTAQVREENDQALGGLAIRRQVELTFSNSNGEHHAMVLIYLPRNVKRCPIFISPNFRGNPSTTDEEGILPLPYNIEPVIKQTNRWPFEMIIKQGYGVATFWYYDFYPDALESHSKSILPLLGLQQSGQTDGQSISAWAWGCSRVLDCVLKMKEVDPHRCIVMGHSRLGKTALWAGAQDKRFAMVVSNCSGCSGAALARRNFGETVGRINKSFPWWFCPRYAQYSNNESAMPIDQHELLALIAPRPLYVASAEEDQWADPHGEFLALCYASRVYQLYGNPSLMDTPNPLTGQYVWSGNLGYHRRAGVHDVTDFDWMAYIRFANERLGKKNKLRS